MKKNTAPILQQAGDIPDWSYSAVESVLTGLKTVDEATYFHCLRVGSYSAKLAKAAGLNDFQQKIAEFSGMLHDVGKMGVEKAILNKPARLSDEEYRIMMSHPVLSETIIKPFGSIEFFQQVMPGVRNHHERIDGLGYPDGLKADDIPLMARIILIVDTLDAMSQNRAYRRGLSMDIIYRELEKFSGSQFDKALVKIFLDSHRFWSKESLDPETLEKIVKRVA